MKFIKTFFISFILIFSLMLGLIWAVDPYDKLGNNLFGFETKAVAQSRENKFYQFEASKTDYNAFIIGSSAAHRYPTAKINELTGLVSYNYAVQHSTPIDYLAILNHIMSKSKPKLILLQLDFVALDDNYKVDPRFYNSPLYKFIKQDENRTKPFFDNDNFTLDALRDTLRVFYVNTLGEARHIYLEHGDYVYERNKKKSIKVAQRPRMNFKFSKERLEILKEFKEICSKKNIKLYVFSSPLSLGHVDVIEKNPRFAKLHKKFNEELGNLFDIYIDFENQSIAKYDHYDYFLDSTHPTKELSEIILERVLVNKHLDLGKEY